MKKPPVVALIPSTINQEYQSFLDGYIHVIGGLSYLFAYSFEIEGYFAILEIVKSDKSKRVVRLPLQFVLATADISNSEFPKYGFV
jgi:hypothetical protein